MEWRTSAPRTCDSQPCLDASLADLDEERFALGYLRRAVAANVLAENNRSLQHKLASLRLFDLRRSCPTHAGLLILNERPTHFLPGAYVQLVRYVGNDQTTAVVAEARASGDLHTVLQTLDLLLLAHITSRPQPATAMSEEMVHDYPSVALRELLVNAMMHRNYASNAPVRMLVFADHLAIHNPGGLYGEATTAAFPQAVDYRNPVVAEAVRVFGFANRFGQGVVRAQRALDLNGNPPAEFTFDGHSFSVVVRKRAAGG